MNPRFSKYGVGQNNKTPGKMHCKYCDSLIHNNSVFLKHKRKYKLRNLDLNLETPGCNQVSIGTKSLYMQDPKVSNFLPFQIKSRKSDE